MKKLSLLFVMLMAYSFSTMAQSTVPVPADPEPSEWYDYKPYVWPNGEATVASAWLFMGDYGTDIMGNQVANDYSFELDSCFNDELLYTILDKSKISYSIYTDFDEIFVFYPEEYPEFDEPTTNVFFYNMLYDDPNDIETYHGTANIEYWGPHFPNRTTQVDGIESMECFPQWRIGIQMHYTEGDVTTSSNIVYLELFPKPVTLRGDVNNDEEVSVLDVTYLIDKLLGQDVAPFNKFNADTDENNKISVQDITTLIDYLLLGTWPE